MSRTVLVIDDDPDLRASLRIRLESMNLSVIAAPDGKSGLASARRHRPDLVILDVTMPGMDGFEVCRRLRKGRRTKDIPVLMLTSLSRMGQIEAGFEAGADDYLTKPFRASQLVAKIEARLALGAGGAGALPNRETLAAEFARRLAGAPILDSLVRIAPGLAVGGRDRDLLRSGPEPEARPLLAAADISPFHVTSPERYLLWTKRTTRRLGASPEVWDAPVKILVRAFAPPLVAAVDTERRLADLSLFAMLPREKGGAEALAALLNSRAVAFLLERVVERRRVGDRDFVRAEELGAIPLPPGGLAGVADARGGAGTVPGAQEREAIDRAAFDAYGFAAGEREAIRTFGI